MRIVRYRLSSVRLSQLSQMMYNPIMPTSSRNSYHSDLKIAVSLDILPKQVLRAIPRSSLYRFKRSDYSTLVGSELSSFVENLDLLKEIARSKAALKTASAVLRIVSFSRSIGVVLGDFASIRIPLIKQRAVAFVDRVSSLMPRARILELLGVSAGRFRSWARGHRLCPASPLEKCRKSYPQQLSVSEVRAIKRAFMSPLMSSWPASSIAWKLINDRSVCASVATITNYAKLLGLRHGIPFHRSRKRGSFSASFPNQAWHLDATVLFTDAHERLYLQLIIDSYSRKILAWSVSDSISGSGTTDLLKKAFASIAEVPPGGIDLFVDGGPENNNRVVSGFLADTPIRKLVARVDVSFSNSMIEAVNKILKYQYIFRSSIPDFAHSESVIARSVDDYGNRPHYALHGLSPNQTYSGSVFDKTTYRENLCIARAARMEENRRSCNPCVPFDIETGENDHELVMG
jgi:transposase InsO family protein